MDPDVVDRLDVIRDRITDLAVTVERLAAVAERAAGHEGRITALERWRWALTGALAAVAAGVLPLTELADAVVASAGWR